MQHTLPTGVRSLLVIELEDPSRFSLSFNGVGLAKVIVVELLL
jgi:hypothetical protein